jgi:PAS domain S-box-containing protein
MIPVLIVDDSLTVRMDLVEAFAASGFDPVPCADGATARDALSRREVGLVVLDVMLPDVDGIELLAELRRSPRHRRTPVMLLSTAAEVKSRIRGLESGADVYVGKPYDAAAVVARARELVRRVALGEEAGEERATVLVVDDSVTVREVLRVELGRAGLEVVTASDGEEGLRVAADRLPAAVIVDGAMPGMDGATFIRQLRSDAALRTTPCILLTASQSVGELRALDAGADAYVRKEEGHDVVLARLESLLRTAAPPSRFGPAALSAPKRVVALAEGRARAEALAERIRWVGYEPVVAASADEALALLAVERVDAVVVDAVGAVPAALDACARLRAAPSHSEVPLLVAGSGDEQELVLRALQAGADDCVAVGGDGVLRARIAALLRRRQFEEDNRLREAFGRSAAILETISDAFFAVDRSWRLVYVNHAFEELVGTKRDVAAGADLWGHAPALRGGSVEEELRRAAEGRGPVTFEEPFPGERWFEVRAFPHEDGLSAHLRDVTERRRSQEVQAHLLGIVGHDLRTPLTSIMMSASAVARDRELPTRLRRPLERVESGAARMSRLINDLLDYSRARLGKGLPVHPVAADLHAICHDAIEAIRAAHPDRTVVFRGEGDGRGEFDSDRVLQALLNLLTNAIRYGTPGAEVTLTCRSESDLKIVEVHNAGGPIPRDLLAHIFEPFKRGDGEGNTWGGVGLGLYIVSQIVNAHRGTVSVRSDAREGTTFQVALPAGAQRGEP